jgi:hypothetical protein
MADAIETYVAIEGSGFGVQGSATRKRRLCQSGGIAKPSFNLRCLFFF